MNMKNIGGLLAGLLGLGMGIGGDLSAQTIFPAADFGAIADDAIDDTQAIRAALHAAGASGGPAEVVLEAGVYQVSAQAEHEEGALMLSGLRDLTLRGQTGRTELRVTTFKLPAMVLRDCRDVRVLGLTIDYDPLPFTQGLVTAVSRQEGWFEYAPAQGYPDPGWDKLSPTAAFGMLMNVAERRPKRPADTIFLDRWEQREGGVWRVYPRQDCRAQLAVFEPGDGYVHLARDGFGAVAVLGSGECLFEEVTIHASPALAFVLVGNEQRITLRRCGVRLREGSDRWISTDGDGVHCQNNRAGPAIEACDFEAMADDGINIYATPMPIVAAAEPGRITLRGGPGVRQGDLLQIYSPIEGVVRDTVAAASVGLWSDQGQEVELERAVAGIVTGDDPKQADCVFNLAACGADFLVRGNTFAAHRGRCMILRTTAGLIEHNIFDNPSATFDIAVANEPQWPEGPFPTGGLTIRGNRIRGGDVAGISIHGFGMSGFSPSPLGEYVITDNELSAVRGAAIHLGRVTGAVVRNNTIADCVMPLAADAWESLDTDLRP